MLRFDRKEIKKKDYDVAMRELEMQIKTMFNDAAGKTIVVKKTAPVPDKPLKTIEEWFAFSNKKAQISASRVHPLLIAGIIVYVTPMIMSAMGAHWPKFIGTIGLWMIIGGVVVSIIEIVG